MPVPNFSPGEVLTANAMDQVGLWKIASGALSGTATNFAGCFPTDFTNFRIVIDQIVFDAAPAELYYQFLNGTTAVNSNYRYAYLGLNALNTSQNANQNTVQTVAWTGIGINAFPNLVLATLTLDVIAPNVASRTFAHTSAIYFDSTNAFRVGLSMNNATTAFDGIRFLTNSAAQFTGKVTIYGYRT
jgi:hypothetical protein